MRGTSAQLATEAGLTDVESGEIAVTVTHPGFDEWWEPYTLGVGPAGDYVKSLDAAGAFGPARGVPVRASRPKAPFDVTAVAWTVRGRA